MRNGTAIYEGYFQTNLVNISRNKGKNKHFQLVTAEANHSGSPVTGIEQGIGLPARNGNSVLSEEVRITLRRKIVRYRN